MVTKNRRIISRPIDINLTIINRLLTKHGKSRKVKVIPSRTRPHTGQVLEQLIKQNPGTTFEQYCENYNVASTFEQYCENKNLKDMDELRKKFNEHMKLQQKKYKMYYKEYTAVCNMFADCMDELEQFD